MVSITSYYSVTNPFYHKTVISSAKNNVQIVCAQLIELIFPYN